MFGDNQAVVMNSSIPHSSLNKRHNALSCHQVEEMIAAKILGYYWIDGKSNPADIACKHWAYPQIWHRLKPLLFYSGEPGDQSSELGWLLLITVTVFFWKHRNLIPKFTVNYAVKP
jgi:hypothetical protein